MSLDEKIKRLRELDKISFPSDQEIEEKAKLIDDINIITKDILQTTGETILNEVNKNDQEKPQEKKYRGLISGRIEKFLADRKERNKATPEQIKQLKLEAEKAELEGRIAVAKTKKRANRWKFSMPTIPDKIFTESDKKSYERTKSKISDHNKDYSDLTG